MTDVVIIGTGIAGISAMKSIAERRPTWNITLVGEENRLPYKRTKISKTVARGFTTDEFALEPPEWYSSLRVELLTGRKAVRIDSESLGIDLDDGTRLDCGYVVLATGARALVPAIPGYEPAYCHTVRQAADVEELRRATADSEEILVVGLGVLGVEITEQLCLAGFSVTAVSSTGEVMPKELNGYTQKIMSELLESSGVRLLCGERVTALEPGGGRIKAVTTGGEISVDRIVFAIGSEPDKSLAAEAGIAAARGVLVDDYLETSRKNIFAAGDVVQTSRGTVTHLWHEAESQGFLAGANIAGSREEYTHVPFRLKCEVFGHYFFSMARPAEDGLNEYETIVDPGNPYRCFYLKGGRLHGVVMADDGVRAKEYEKAVRDGIDAERINKLFLS